MSQEAKVAIIEKPLMGNNQKERELFKKKSRQSALKIKALRKSRACPRYCHPVGYQYRGQSLHFIRKIYI